MKTMKKMVAMLLVAVLVMAVLPAAFADGNTGSITVTNPVAGNTYKLYKVFDAIGDGTNIVYTLVDGKTAVPDGFSLVDGYVQHAGDATQLTADEIAAIKAYIENDSPVETIVAEENATSITFSGLADGYYYITTTTGALVTVDSVNGGAVSVSDKNEKPEINKEVQEDSDSTWGATNDADIGQTVNFKTTVSAKKGALNYVVHDVMQNTLTLAPDSVTVAGLTKGTDYTVVTSGLTDGCTFHVEFAQTYLDTITENTDIVITYSAVLNENALIYDEANVNKTRLEYGNENYTVWHETKTYTFKFELIKTDNQNKPLTNAEFKLYDAQTGGAEIALVDVGNGVYRVATPTEKSAEGFTPAVIVAGQVEIQGLDGNTTYYLEETKAPAGYNKLSARTAVAIAKANLAPIVLDNNVYQEGGVQVINQAGNTLPTTGGMGTTLFYVLGSILVVGAGVILIAKKRMGAAE